LPNISEDLRETMRQWTSGVCIICSQNENYTHGMTVNSFTSISLQPPLVSITLANQTRTYNLVHESRRFSVSILGKDQQILADRFSGKIQEDRDRFEGIPTFDLPDGMPAITGALAVLECSVENEIPLSNSTLFIAKVTYTHVEGKGSPLIYHNRNYFSL